MKNYLSKEQEWEIDILWKLSNGDQKIFVKLFESHSHNREKLTLWEREAALKYVEKKYDVYLQ